MKFPILIDEEDMPLLIKQWALAGYRVFRTDTGGIAICEGDSREPAFRAMMVGHYDHRKRAGVFFENLMEIGWKVFQWDFLEKNFTELLDGTEGREDTST